MITYLSDVYGGKDMERWRKISGMITSYNICYILNRTECFWLFSAHRCQKFVGKLERAFKCVLWSCDQSIGVVFSFSFCMQSRMQLLKSGIWGLVVLLSVPCSCLIIFCLSNSCRLFPCISTCQILSLHYNLFQILPPDLSLYKPFSYCML